MKGGLPEEFESHDIDLEGSGVGGAMIVREVNFKGSTSVSPLYKTSFVQSSGAWHSTFQVGDVEEFSVVLISKEGVNWNIELNDPQNNLIPMSRLENKQFSANGSEIIYRKAKITSTDNKESDIFIVKSPPKGNGQLLFHLSLMD